MLTGLALHHSWTCAYTHTHTLLLSHTFKGRVCSIIIYKQHTSWLLHACVDDQQDVVGSFVDRAEIAMAWHQCFPSNLLTPHPHKASKPFPITPQPRHSVTTGSVPGHDQSFGSRTRWHHHVLWRDHHHSLLHIYPHSHTHTHKVTMGVSFPAVCPAISLRCGKNAERNENDKDRNGRERSLRSFFVFCFFFSFHSWLESKRLLYPSSPCAVPSSCSSLFNSPLTSNMSHSRNDNDRNMPAGKAHYSPSILSRQLAVCLFLMEYCSVFFFFFCFFAPQTLQKFTVTVCYRYFIVFIAFACRVSLILRHWSAGERADTVVWLAGNIPPRVHLSPARVEYKPRACEPVP